MKICVTGHTSGVGKAIYESFKEKGYDILGFSRSNGFDIDDAGCRENLIKQSEEFDVFINNAYSVNQTTLLKQIIEKWDGQDKLVINIGTKATMLPMIVPGDEEYVRQKTNQEKIVRDRFFDPLPQVTNIIIGLTDGGMGKRFAGKKIDPKYLSFLVETIIMNKESIAIQEIVVDVPKQHWREIKYAEQD